MKTLLIFVLMCNWVSAQEPSLKLAIPARKEYEKALRDIAHASEDIVKLRHYDKLIVLNEKELVRFRDMNEFDQHIFMLYFSERLSGFLIELEILWLKEIVVLAVVKDAPKDRPTLELLLKLRKRLRDLRYIHYKRHEKLAKSIFEKFKDQIPQNDQDRYLEELEKQRKKFVRRLVLSNEKMSGNR